MRIVSSVRTFSRNHSSDCVHARTHAHNSVPRTARGGAWIQPVALPSSRPQFWLWTNLRASHVDGSGFFSCFFPPPNEESESTASVGVPPDAWLNPGAVLCRAAWKRCQSDRRSGAGCCWRWCRRRDPPLIRMLMGNAWRQRWRDLSKGAWTPVRSVLEGGSAERTLPGFYLLFPRHRQATILRFRWENRALASFNWSEHVTFLILTTLSQPSLAFLWLLKHTFKCSPQRFGVQHAPMPPHPPGGLGYTARMSLIKLLCRCQWKRAFQTNSVG